MKNQANKKRKKYQVQIIDEVFATAHMEDVCNVRGPCRQTGVDLIRANKSVIEPAMFLHEVSCPRLFAIRTSCLLTHCLAVLDTFQLPLSAWLFISCRQRSFRVISNSLLFLLISRLVCVDRVLDFLRPVTSGGCSQFSQYPRPCWTSTS